MSWCHDVSLLNPGMLGHHAVVVALRQFDPVLPHQRCAASPRAWRPRPSGGTSVRASRRAAISAGCFRPLRHDWRGSPGYPTSASNSRRSLQRVESAQHRPAHLLHTRPVRECADDQVTVTLERVRREFVHRIDHGKRSSPRGDSPTRAKGRVCADRVPRQSRRRRRREVFSKLYRKKQMHSTFRFARIVSVPTVSGGYCAYRLRKIAQFDNRRGCRS